MPRSRVVRMWADRRNFGGLFSWSLAVYNRVLLHWPNMPLPARRAVVRIRMAKAERDVYVRLGTSDLWVAREIFQEGEYAPVVGGSIGMPRTIVDLGSNIGLSIALWQSRFPGVKVVGVEPDEGNMSVCRRNARDSGGSEVTLLQACVAGVARKVALDRSDREWAFRLKDDSSDSATVDAFTLDEVLRRADMSTGPIDLMKCDIEGAEAELFDHCLPWIARVNNMLIELHAPYNREKFMASLGEHGRRFDISSLKKSGPVEVLFLRGRAVGEPIPATS